MQVKITPKPATSEVQLDVTVPAETFAPYVDKASKKISTDHPLPGFRPGKAPQAAVIEAFGQDRVLREALDLALPPLFVQVVMDHNLSVISRPSIAIQQLVLDMDLHFVATVHVLPHVEVGDPTHIKVSKRQVEVTDDEVRQELNYLAKMRATYLDIPRPAQLGDTLTVDFHVTIQGRLVEGGQSSNHPVHLGEGHFVPDFEQKLIGANAGDVRQFTINFPADFPQEEYRGQEAQVWVKVHRVSQRVVPEVNDEFAKGLGKFTSLEHLTSELKSGIAKDKDRKERERLQTEISQKLVDSSTIDHLPDILIEREIDHRLEELHQLLTAQNKTFEQYLFEQQKTVAEVRQELIPTATQSIKTSLVLKAFAEKEQIEVAEDVVAKRASRYLTQFTSPQEAHKSIDPEELRTNISSMLRTQQALKKLEELVQIEEEAPTAAATPTLKNQLTDTPTKQ